MDFDAILKAGQELGGAKIPADGGSPYAVMPEGSCIADLEQYLVTPKRARGNVVAHQTATFVGYFNHFKADASVIFADQEQFRIVGIIDYHAADKPAFGEHRVTYTTPRSKEWQAWRGASGRKMSQTDFAQFIEDNVVDIRTPAGADVLEVSRSLQAKKSVDFNSSIRLADGSQQFTYNETVDGATAKGTIKVPDEFTLGIPVFFGGALYEVRARLRYRIDSGKLWLWYDLYRPEHIEQDAFEHVVTDIADKSATEVWMGKP
jgi:uncharacterized protein YfdQ (DUF2303 family)